MEYYIFAGIMIYLIIQNLTLGYLLHKKINKVHDKL